MEKICKVCGVNKPYSEYYKHPKMLDGHLGKCKECQRSASRAARATNIDAYREYDRKRGGNPDRVAARKEYAKTDDGRLAGNKAKAAYSDRHPLRKAAHILTGNAIRDGRLVKPEAYESCGSTVKIEGHHDDYTKPLDVRWLCECCHKRWHRNNKPVYA